MNAPKRHIPLRSCVACRSKMPKRQLLRVVAKSEGGVQADSSGKLNGRGAYLCQACSGDADRIKRGRLEHTLRTKLDNQQWDGLLADISSHAATIH